MGDRAVLYLLLSGGGHHGGDDDCVSERIDLLTDAQVREVLGAAKMQMCILLQGVQVPWPTRT